MSAAVQITSIVCCRIVAYSDSEGEDEPFRLTRRKKKKAQGREEAEAEKDDAPSTSSPAAVIMPAATQIARGQHQIFRAARSLFVPPSSSHAPKIPPIMQLNSNQQKCAHTLPSLLNFY